MTARSLSRTWARRFRHWSLRARRCCAWLDDTAEDTGALPGGALDLVGRIVKPLTEEISAITTDLPLLPIRLNARTMLNSATVVLR
ncbi:hypothetical protein CSE45_2252 [Citreicella sp. SE45]|nr:hypothetical protein CSE45_2252 [Citreicella sp. SE45]